MASSTPLLDRPVRVLARSDLVRIEDPVSFGVVRGESNPGAISIVEDGAGRLSEAADREGALTVAATGRRSPTTT